MGGFWVSRRHSAQYKWRECSPENAQRFSAVPYLFGTFPHRYRKAPWHHQRGSWRHSWSDLVPTGELESIDDKIIRTVLADYDAETAVWDDPAQVEGLMKQWEADCDKVRADHEEKLNKAKAEGKKPPRLRLPKKPGDARSSWSPPAGLFNATICRYVICSGVPTIRRKQQLHEVDCYERTFPKFQCFARHFEMRVTIWLHRPTGLGQLWHRSGLATIAEGYAIVRDIQRRALRGSTFGYDCHLSHRQFLHPSSRETSRS